MIHMGDRAVGVVALPWTGTTSSYGMIGLEQMGHVGAGRTARSCRKTRLRRPRTDSATTLLTFQRRVGSGMGENPHSAV